MEIRRFCILALLLALPLLAGAQRFWMGVPEGATMPLTLFYDPQDTTQVPLLFSPCQTEDPILFTNLSFPDGELRYEVSSAALKLALRLQPDGTLAGHLKQGLAKMPLTMHSTPELWWPKRPQTPQEPYSFDQVEVIARYKDRHGESVVLSGTLALPRGVEKGCPVALLVSGSGQQDRDETLLMHKPFLVMAEYLAQHGIATLRYDDRGVGGSRGPLKEATTADFAEDAWQMLRALKSTAKQQHLALGPVGIIGHSEGAFIGQMLAAQHRRDIDFLIMIGGQGCNGGEVLLQQNYALLLAQGVPDSLAALRLRSMQAMYDIMDAVPADGYYKAFCSAVDSITAGYSNDQRKQALVDKSNLFGMSQQLAAPWLRYFVKEADPQRYLPKVRCTVLALGGGNDLQVVAADNLPRIAALAPHAQTICFPNLNHMMQHCTTGHPGEYGLIEETMADEVLSAIAHCITHLKQ